MNIRRIITALVLLTLFFGCKTTGENPAEYQKTARVNIINSTNHRIFEVYFQDDTMTDRGKNLISMAIEAGNSRYFDLEPGKYKMIVVFVVNDVPVPVQYNDLLLPDYEYAWEISEENVDLPKTGSYEGYIFDLGTDSSPEEPAEEGEEIIIPEEIPEE